MQSTQEPEFFAKTSPLRNIPSSLRPDQRVLLNGIRFSIEVLDVSYRRLEKSLLAIAEARENKSPFPDNMYPHAFADAWSIIDTLVRLTNLVKRLPKGERHPAVRSFLSETYTAEQLRHAYQHLEKEIKELAAQNLPVWGTLHWDTPIAGTESYRLHTLLPGTIQSQNIPFKDDKAPMRSVVLRAYGHVFDILAAMRSVERLARSLEASLAPQFRGQPGSMTDIYVSVDWTPHPPESTVTA